MEFFHLIKASQKSGKKDAVIWFTAKSVARANLQLDVALEKPELKKLAAVKIMPNQSAPISRYMTTCRKKAQWITPGANATNCRTMTAPGCQKSQLKTLTRKRLRPLIVT